MSLASISKVIVAAVGGIVSVIKTLSGAKSAPLTPKPPLSDEELGWKPREDEEPKPGPRKVPN